MLQAGQRRMLVLQREELWEAADGQQSQGTVQGAGICTMDLPGEDQLHLPFLPASNPAGLVSFSIGSTTEVDFQNSSPGSQKTILWFAKWSATIDFRSQNVSYPELFTKEKKCWVAWCSLTNYL